MIRKTSLRFGAYLLWFLLLTLLFAVVNFPREIVTGWVNGQLSAATNGLVRAREASPGLSLSMKLSGLTVDAGGTPLAVGDAVVSPNLAAFLTGRRGAAVRLSGPWGSSSLRARSGKEEWALDLRSFSADLESVPFPETFPYRFEGTAAASGSFQGGSGSSDKKVDGQGEISGEGIKIGGGLLEAVGLSPLDFSRFRMVFNVKDGVLTIGENNLEGDLSAQIRGTVRLTPGRLETSRLDLTVEIKPGSRIRETVAPFFSLAGARPRADGSATFRIRGTIAKPSVTG